MPLSALRKAELVEEWSGSTGHVELELHIDRVVVTYAMRGMDHERAARVHREVHRFLHDFGWRP